MRIQVLCDNPDSWIVPYAKELVQELSKNYDAVLFHNPKAVTEGDFLVLLSCERIFKYLHLNKFNLVVHESHLPHGKGWSPLTWQILEGKNIIPVVLFEATEKVDSGLIYGHINIELDGTELIDDLRKKQANATRELLLNFFDAYPNVQGNEQKGRESFYFKRSAVHSQLDLNKTIAEQFNLFRVCDNERYPPFFVNKGVKYILKIYKDERR